MLKLNELLMIAIAGFLLWAVNLYPINPFLSLILNFVLIAALVIYLMQFLGLIKNILPTIRIFY
ncbi:MULTISPECIES: Thivi_2564 family membrane protein [unclassified Legionella]|uniref:Thivi_2564 family membrane protein n=1 Tax=unclassified Legionella TaxID=2622702 RepID=UPI001055D803|nr:MULTISPECIES: Thivi_2564 family membrane protein [unclassified Legionella]MDI9819116.1 hypothetical protein [Legionella sp. PL877]